MRQTQRQQREIELGEILTCVYCGRRGTKAFVRVPVAGDELGACCTKSTTCYRRRRARRPLLVPARAA